MIVIDTFSLLLELSPMYDSKFISVEDWRKKALEISFDHIQAHYKLPMVFYVSSCKTPWHKYIALFARGATLLGHSLIHSRLEDNLAFRSIRELYPNSSIYTSRFETLQSSSDFIGDHWCDLTGKPWTASEVESLFGVNPDAPDYSVWATLVADYRESSSRPISIQVVKEMVKNDESGYLWDFARSRSIKTQGKKAINSMRDIGFYQNGANQPKAFQWFLASLGIDKAPIPEHFILGFDVPRR